MKNEIPVYTFTSPKRDVVSILGNGFLTIRTERKLSPTEAQAVSAAAFKQFEIDEPKTYKRILELMMKHFN